MKLALVIPGLGPGGAERQLSAMANYWARKGWRITLITFSPEAAPSFYPLHPKIRRVGLSAVGYSASLGQALSNNIERVSWLRRAIKLAAPDVLISFGYSVNVISILATQGLGIRVLASERVDAAAHPMGGAWRVLRSLTYSLAYMIVVQTTQCCGSVPLGARKRTAVIPNAVFIDSSRAMDLSQRHGTSARKVLAMGRFDLQKGFDLLIRAFAALPPKLSDWSLAIWGDGSLRPELEGLTHQLGLPGRVRFPGVSRDPAAVFASGDIFVLSSRYEGFPNVLLEAMSCGLPVISFDCRSGPRAIIRDGVDGLLVPAQDVNALAAAIARLIGDEAERTRLAGSGREAVRRYLPEVIMPRWERLIQQESNGKRIGA